MAEGDNSGSSNVKGVVAAPSGGTNFNPGLNSSLKSQARGTTSNNNNDVEEVANRSV